MDAARIQAICDRLRQDTGATLTMVVQANGRLIANCGDPAGMDGDALKLLARSDADVANLLSDQECVVLQPNQNLVMRLLAGGPIVLVIFAAASSLERVRELTREAAEQMEAA
ncbi:MAG TPA: hypothetical protein VLW85_20525 [Myxococcales bacterium]|nr:hypothetical protein [Myxococcales bacterium]